MILNHQTHPSYCALLGVFSSNLLYTDGYKDNGFVCWAGAIRGEFYEYRAVQKGLGNVGDRENRENNLSSRRIYKRSGGDPNIGTYRSRLLEES